MIGFANNPYWVSVQNGVDTANEVLSSRGGEVKWIVAGANIDVPTVDQAIRAAATQGYNGIGFAVPMVLVLGILPLAQAFAPRRNSQRQL